MQQVHAEGEKIETGGGAPSRFEAALCAALPFLLITVATLAAYWNSFDAGFILDSKGAIVGNPTIRSLWTSLLPVPPEMAGNTVAGRPVLNFTLALNYAAGWLNPFGYHAANLAIHLLAAFALYLLVKGAARLSRHEPTAEAASPIALAAATLWAVHPLTTASVTYVIQRAEALAGFFYLATLYCLFKSAISRRPARWQTAGVLACLLGVATKETVATAPFAALLFDRAFLAGSFRAALKTRWRFYAGLASTLVALALLLASTSLRGGTAGLSAPLTPWEYFQTELWAIPHYLALVFNPSQMTFLYSTSPITGFVRLFLPGLLTLLLFCAALLAAWRWPKAGFAGALFFLILAPTSSFIPIAHPVFEHRMYLPLACVLTLCVVAVRWLLSLAGAAGWNQLAQKILPAALAVSAAFALAWQTHARNALYANEIALWQDTIRKSPENARAYSALGEAFMGINANAPAIEALRASLALEPRDPVVVDNLILAYRSSGMINEARAALEYRRSLAADR